MSTPWLTLHLTRCARWDKYDDRKKRWKPVDCPGKVALTYIESVGEWLLHPIDGVIECPTLRRDGTLLAENGYDRATGLYLHYQGEKLNMPECPTREDALEALELLKVPFSEFPFVERYDLSVALAALITAIVRRGLPTAPLFAIDAPMPGSGKGLIITIIGLIVLGRNPPLMNYSPREEEVEKRLDALLIQSAPVVAIDNIQSTVYGEALCTVLTAEKKMSPGPGTVPHGHGPD